MSASLFAKGKDQGFLHSEEIIAAFPNAEVDVTGLDEFYSSLFEHGIEVVDQPIGRRTPPERDQHQQAPPALQQLCREGPGWPADAAVAALCRAQAGRLGRRWVRTTRLIVSTMWTGMRIVRAWSAIARVIAWRIHQVA